MPTSLACDICIITWYAIQRIKNGTPANSRKFGVARAVFRQPSNLKQVGAISIMPTVTTPVYDATSPRKEVNSWAVGQNLDKCNFHAYSSVLEARPCAMPMIAKHRMLGLPQQYLHAHSFSKRWYVGESKSAPRHLMCNKESGQQNRCGRKPYTEHWHTSKLRGRTCLASVHLYVIVSSLVDAGTPEQEFQ